MSAVRWLLLGAATLGCEQSLEIGYVSKADTTGETDPTHGGAVAASPTRNEPTALAGTTALGGAEPTAPAAVAGGGGAAGAATDDETLWSSSVESGDLSDWTGDGPVAGGEQLHVATVQASTDRAHSGRYSAKISFDTSDDDYHWAELFRAVYGGAAYYSAWFYLEAAHTPAVYWTLSNFFGEANAGDMATRHGLWDVNLNARSLYFYDETSKTFADASPLLTYPIGRWFQVEILLDYAPPSASHVSVWQDGTLILDRTNLQSPTEATLYWGIGSQTEQLSPAACTLYIDDVVISRRRVGP
ncbi:MAG TPA: heparin lyase I family protein [Polyangiaceae bacterium]|nr:heparin lyase I family protein [Polyangiaceae bacterium]